MKAIQTLAQTGNTKSYEYTHEEAQACFAQIEEAAAELWEALGLGSVGAETREEPPASPGPAERVSEGLSDTRFHYTLSRSKIDRAIRAPLKQD